MCINKQSYITRDVTTTSQISAIAMKDMMTKFWQCQLGVIKSVVMALIQFGAIMTVSMTFLISLEL